MSFRDGPFQDLKIPLGWLAAAALAVCVLVAGTLLFISGGQGGRGPAQQAFDAADKPVARALSAPVGWTRSLVQGVRGYFFAVSDNRRLKAENLALRHTADLAVALTDENQRLHALLGMHTEPPIPMVAGRTVLDARGPFSNTRLINVGDEKDVQVGNPVMNERGLVGRIVGVTHGASRILLLSDVASRVPVLIDRTDARAILTGDGGANPRLGYMRGANPVRVGDRVLTSGDGGVIPRGLPVGVAAKGLDGQWRVKLNAELTAIDFVQVLKFKDFTQLVKLQELDRLRMPPPTAGAQTTTPAETVHATNGAAPTPAARQPVPAASAGVKPRPTPPATAASKRPAQASAAAAAPRKPVSAPPAGAKPKPAATGAKPATAAVKPARVPAAHEAR